MVGNSSDSERLKGKIGVESEPQIYEVEQGVIRRFARAIGDSNPLWQGEEYARQSKYGGIIAPPTLVSMIGFEEIQPEQIGLAPNAGMLHASTELECYQPVRAGDTITFTTRIAEVRERQGKMGKMTFVTLDITYKNQRQESVARCRQMIIGLT